MIGAILGLTARPLLESLMHVASSLRQDALAILRGWITKRWECVNADRNVPKSAEAKLPAFGVGDQPVSDRWLRSSAAFHDASEAVAERWQRGRGCAPG